MATNERDSIEADESGETMRNKCGNYVYRFARHEASQ